MSTRGKQIMDAIEKHAPTGAESGGEMNWDAVARFLEDAARKKQDEANGAVTAMKQFQKDETASLLRTLAGAIRFGLTRS